VKTDGGEIVLTADACYMRRTLEEMRLPPSFLDDRELMLDALKRFRALEAKGARLIFGHDPELWRQLNDGPLRGITAGGFAKAPLQ
jgi:N-acyl homoserine lactone hydrolase